MYVVQCAMYTKCTWYSVRCTLNVRRTVCHVQQMYIVQCDMYTKCTTYMYDVQCAMYVVHYSSVFTDQCNTDLV